MQIYLDGSLAYTRSGVKLIPTSSTLTCGGRVSADAGTRSRALGFLDMDELRWYNLPLSASDVATVFAAVDPGVDRTMVSTAGVGNIVQRTADPRVFEVPGLELPSSPNIVVGPSGGSWRRTNRAVTKAEILTPIQRRIKVCWGREGRYTEAGTTR
jgi:hypothetical protein